MIESHRFTCISDDATNYENTSSSGEETDTFCRMTFLLQKAGKALNPKKLCYLYYVLGYFRYTV